MEMGNDAAILVLLASVYAIILLGHAVAVVLSYEDGGDSQ